MVHSHTTQGDVVGPYEPSCHSGCCFSKTGLSRALCEAIISHLSPERPYFHPYLLAADKLRGLASTSTGSRLGTCVHGLFFRFQHRENAWASSRRVLNSRSQHGCIPWGNGVCLGKVNSQDSQSTVYSMLRKLKGALNPGGSLAIDQELLGPEVNFILSFFATLYLTPLGAWCAKTALELSQYPFQTIGQSEDTFFRQRCSRPNFILFIK